MGLDANSYFDEVADGKKRYSVKTLHSLTADLKLASCFGAECPAKHTTNCPRTYLQPQLNKAVQREQIGAKLVDFRAPKDWLIFDPQRVAMVGNSLCIDNTGKGTYDGDLQYVLPSEYFPSDHAIISADNSTDYRTVP